MWDIITGEFFWGIVVGAVLTILGAWLLAKFTASEQRKLQKKIVVDFCIDTIKNLQGVIKQMDDTRDRTRIIFPDLLGLIDVEMGVYARNREHLLHLPEGIRDKVRAFMNNCALKRADVAAKLAQFDQQWALANQVEVEGRGPEAGRIRTQANDGPLKAAHDAADKLAILAREAPSLILELSNVK